MSTNSLNFGAPKLQRFYIDDDEARFIEIDPGDTGVIARWNAVEAWFTDMEQRMQGANPDADDPESIRAFMELYSSADREAREKVNFLFASDVCTPIVGEHGSVMRTVNGEPLFMLIINAILPKYDEAIRAEADRATKHIKKHTAKYTK